MTSRTILLATLIAFCIPLVGCSVRGYSKEQVRQIRKIDRELCDLRIETMILSLATIPPLANDQGMNLNPSPSR